MAKILFCASTLSHIQNFHLPYIEFLSKEGHEIFTATNSCEAVPYTTLSAKFSFKKNILSLSNIILIFKLRKFLANNKFDKISTHTALASSIIRMSVLLLPRNERPKVYYIAHGFLFKNKPGFKKWLYLLPEILLSSVTDILMVMNQEDFELAQKYQLSKKDPIFINGIGFDNSRFRPLSKEEKNAKRLSLGFSPHDYLFIYAAEFSKRKNHELLIRSFAKIAEQIPKAKLLLAGDGKLLDKNQKLVSKLAMENRIFFLGHVQEIEKIYPICDTAVSTSKIEGLPFNIMEAKSCGLSLLISNIKGHRDLVNNKREFMFNSEHELCEKLVEKAKSGSRETDWSESLAKYSLSKVMPDILNFYKI